MAIFKKGTQVVVQPTLNGEVLDQQIFNDTINYLVAYTNDEGIPHQRWFSESEISEVK